MNLKVESLRDHYLGARVAILNNDEMVRLQKWSPRLEKVQVSNCGYYNINLARAGQHIVLLAGALSVPRLVGCLRGPGCRMYSLLVRGLFALPRIVAFYRAMQ